MEKFIPFEKLSKKEQRKRNAQKRGSWGALNPVTRKPANPKAYHRQKARKWTKDSIPCLFLTFPDFPAASSSPEFHAEAMFLPRVPVLLPVLPLARPFCGECD